MFFSSFSSSAVRAAVVLRTAPWPTYTFRMRCHGPRSRSVGRLVGSVGGSVVGRLVGRLLGSVGLRSLARVASSIGRPKETEKRNRNNLIGQHVEQSNDIKTIFGEGAACLPDLYDLKELAPPLVAESGHEDATVQQHTSNRSEQSNDIKTTTGECVVR